MKRHGPTWGSAPVAVITGASRGLGAALAEGLAGAGWRLVIDARDGDELAATADRLAELTDVIALPGDIVAARHRAELATAAADLGGTALLVNNAATLGGSPPPRLATVASGALLDTLRVNLVAPVALTQLVLPQLRATVADGGAAAVLNVTCRTAIEARPGHGVYGVAKAGLELASAVLELEEPDLLVWSVDPGPLRTRMRRQAFPDREIADRPRPETVVPAFLRLINERLPSGRYRAMDLLAGRRRRGRRGDR